MNKTAKKRLCWNCEGSVLVEEELCPFCGVSVALTSLDGTDNSFIPPYSPQALQGSAVPRAPYGSSGEPIQAGTAIDIEDAEPSFDEFKRAVFAVALLLSGSVFLLFGMALALFSHDGVLTLKWNGSIWFIYTSLALPLLLFGWKALMKLKEE